jgi:hypothetical protein
MIESELKEAVFDHNICMPFYACGQCCAEQATGYVRQHLQDVACPVAMQDIFVRNVSKPALWAEVIAAIAAPSH